MSITINHVNHILLCICCFQYFFFLKMPKKNPYMAQLHNFENKLVVNWLFLSV